MPCDILFYTSYSRALSFIYIGHLYQLARKYEVVLLTEKLDEATAAYLRDKKTFPGLKAVVRVDQYGRDENLAAHSARMAGSARSCLDEFRPKLVAATNDYASLFELYLLRMAKERGLRRLTIGGGLSAESSIARKWLRAYRAELFPGWLPRALRVAAANLRAAAGHVLVYWILPLFAAQKPFPGPSSYVLFTGQSGMRDSECQVLFSERDRAVSLADQVPPARLAVVPHPVLGAARVAFERPFPVEIDASRPIALLLHPAETFGFDGGLRPFDRRVCLEMRIRAIQGMKDVLAGWRIMMKPHPAFPSGGQLYKMYGPLLESVEVIPPDRPVEPFIMKASLIADLPRAASTATYFASVARPGCPNAVLDLLGEALGDFHRSTSGVTYVRTLEGWLEFLGRVKRGDKDLAGGAPPVPPGGDYPDLPSLLESRFALEGRAAAAASGE